MTNARNSAFSLDMQYSYSPLICKVNRKVRHKTRGVKSIRHRGMVLSRDPEVLILPFVFAPCSKPCRGRLSSVSSASSADAFALLLYRRQWRVVICFVLPQANAGRDFSRPVAVRRVVIEVGFFVWVVVQVE